MEHQLDLEHRLTAVEGLSETNAKRLDEMKDTINAINRIAVSVEKMATKQDAMNTSIAKLTSDVEVLKAEPGKRWKFVIEKAIYFVVAAFLGFIFAQLGLEIPR